MCFFFVCTSISEERTWQIAHTLWKYNLFVGGRIEMQCTFFFPGMQSRNTSFKFWIYPNGHCMEAIVIDGNSWFVRHQVLLALPPSSLQVLCQVQFEEKEKKTLRIWHEFTPSPRKLHVFSFRFTWYEYTVVVCIHTSNWKQKQMSLHPKTWTCVAPRS